MYNAGSAITSVRTSSTSPCQEKITDEKPWFFRFLSMTFLYYDATVSNPAARERRGDSYRPCQQNSRDISD